MSNALQLLLFLLWPQGSSFERAEFKRRNANAVDDKNAAQQMLDASGGSVNALTIADLKSRRRVNSDVRRRYVHPRISQRATIN